MFVALEITQFPQDTAWNRIRGIFARPTLHLEPRQCSGANYFLLRAKVREEPDWDDILETARESARWLLLPDALQPPEPIPALRFYNSGDFDRLVLLETACALVSHSRMPMYRRVLGFVDEDGSYSDMLPQLLHHYTSVRVLTRNLSLYREVSEQLMQDLGAPVVLADQLSSMRDCVLLLLPAPFTSREDLRLSCPVLTTDASACTFRYQPEDLFSSPAAGLPLYTPPPPPGISPHRLAGALYELCGLEEISTTPRSLLHNSRLCTLEQAVRLFGESAANPYDNGTFSKI